MVPTAGAGLRFISQRLSLHAMVREIHSKGTPVPHCLWSLVKEIPDNSAIVSLIWFPREPNRLTKLSNAGLWHIYIYHSQTFYHLLIR